MTRRNLGRDLTDEDLEAIRAICADPAFPTRAAIAREVCRALRWTRPDGALKDMSAKVALARMDADGLIGLPAPTHRPVRPGRHLEPTIEAGPPIACRLNELDNIAITICAQHSAASAVSNEMIGRSHYLGYTPTSDLRQRGVGAMSWRSEGRRQQETVKRHVLAGELEAPFPQVEREISAHR